MMRNGYSILTLALCALLVTHNTHATNTTYEYASTATASEVPFPGSSWLAYENNISTFSYNDVTYLSGYDAMLKGDPGANPVRNFNAWINSFIFSPETAEQFVDYFGIEWGYYALSYCRNFVAGVFVYYVTSAIFHYFCYVHPQSEEIFKDRLRPETSVILDQIALAQSSLFLYVMLPVFSDWLVEEGYTMCVYTIDEMGGVLPYLFFTVVYFACVEIGIYWMHRTLHTNKWMYKHIHLLHHKYNQAHTLTPWASIAFNPLDGILQACPYVICMLFVPCHYLTHICMVFFTAIWSTYIHDSMDFNIDPIMGSKYHTVHHTHYMYNFGQIFTFCDAYWGTLRVPTEKTGIIKKKD